MVVDFLTNKGCYTAMHVSFEAAFRYLQQCEKEPPEVGRYELESDKLFALVQEYTTTQSEELLWEAHKRYIDIQYVLSGQEIIEWSNIDLMPEGTPYNSEKDTYKCSSVDGSPITMHTGYFAIFFPQDLHKPCCKAAIPSVVKKIVVKIAI